MTRAPRVPVSREEMALLNESETLDKFRSGYLVRFKGLYDPIIVGKRVNNIWFRKDELMKKYDTIIVQEAAVRERIQAARNKEDSTVYIPARIKHKIGEPVPGTVDLGVAPIGALSPPKRGDSLPDSGEQLIRIIQILVDMNYKMDDAVKVMREEVGIMKEQLAMFRELASKK
jgi:hypothetical protein